MRSSKRESLRRFASPWFHVELNDVIWHQLEASLGFYNFHHMSFSFSCMKTKEKSKLHLQNQRVEFHSCMRGDTVLTAAVFHWHNFPAIFVRSKFLQAFELLEIQTCPGF